MSDEFSQKEEDTFRKELFRRMDNQDIILDKLLTQTTKTNGRVTKLEDRTVNYSEITTDVSKLKNARDQFLAGAAVVMFLGGTIIFYVNKDINYRISQAVLTCDNCQIK